MDNTEPLLPMVYPETCQFENCNESAFDAERWAVEFTDGTTDHVIVFMCANHVGLDEKVVDD